MGEPVEVEVSNEKMKKKRLGQNELAEKEITEKTLTEEPATIIRNGTGNRTSVNAIQEPSTKGKQKPIKITKVIKTEKPTEADKPTIKEEELNTCSPTSSNSSSDNFYGFDIEVMYEKLLKKQEVIQRVLVNLNGSGDATSSKYNSVEKQNVVLVESDSEDEKREEGNMTVDTDSDQMEIDVDNTKDTLSKADSIEFIDVETNRKDDEDSDIFIFENDSLKSNSHKSPTKSSPVKDSKTDDNTNSSLLQSTQKGDKIEYCGGCEAEVDDAEDGICCDGQCERWFHLRCSGLSQIEYNELSLDENAKWACSRCSGKPSAIPKKNNRQLVSVRKDLGVLSTPSPKRKSLTKEGRTPKIDISNPIFLKPFDFGWKRELVYRSTNDSQNRRQGDIYYYTPKGKKLRSLREISDNLSGTDLTTDNFTFWKEPIGIDDPVKEIIRDAKFKMVAKDSVASPAQPKKVTPKVSKVQNLSTKLTATVTPLDTTNSSPPITSMVSTSTPKASASVTPKASASVTPRVVLKGRVSTGPKVKFTPSKASPCQPPKIAVNKEKKKKSISDDELEMGMLPPMWESLTKSKDKSAGVKRPLEESEGMPPAKKAKIEGQPSNYMQNFIQNISTGYTVLLHAFQYLKVQELLRASRVCRLWHDIALHRTLWETVRMKNSQVKDWEGFAATLRSTGTKHLDLRKILMPDKPDALKTMWSECVKALSKVNTLIKLDLCRCTSFLLEQIPAKCPQLEYISAGAIKSSQVNFNNLGNCPNLTELRLKGQCGVEIINMNVLANLTKLKNLSLTMIKNMAEVLEVVGKMNQLESLELGEFMSVTEKNVSEAFSQLNKLKRLRLEKGQQDCPTDAILKSVSQLPSLVQLELINFDVKTGFDDSLGLCSNIKSLLIIPTYVTQSATTNHLLIEGVSKLSKTLGHFVWGLTLELLRVTDLFIDQWEMNLTTKTNTPAKSLNPPPQKKSSGDSIPILKPSAGYGGGDGQKGTKEGTVTQVDVLQLPKLHKVLTTLLPNTKIIILKVPFSATWRQTINGSNQ